MQVACFGQECNIYTEDEFNKIVEENRLEIANANFDHKKWSRTNAKLNNLTN
jgi:hypothetical protein